MKRRQSNIVPASVVGREGETLAAFLLLHKDYKIITRNLLLGRIGEIDILAYDNASREIVIVEVKTVVSRHDPVFRIDWQKRRKLSLLARIVQERYPDKQIRVDAVTISRASDHPHLTHYTNILS